MTAFTESEIEVFSLAELRAVGFDYLSGPFLTPVDSVGLPETSAEAKIPYGETARSSFSDVTLMHTFTAEVKRLNPLIPETARAQAVKTVLSVYSPQLIVANEIFHKYLTEGIPVEVMKDGQQRGERVWLVDFQNSENNTFMAVNQFTVTEHNQNKRLDVILFVNGLPLVVVELKNPAETQATVHKAYDQLQTYKLVIPSLFYYNAFCVISDGLEARAGTISAPFSRFQAWKTVDGKKESGTHVNQLETLIRGMLNKTTLLDLIRNFIVFEKEKKVDTKTGLTQIETVKKLAAYHQYYAVNEAVARTRLAVAENGNRKAGVVWHTQGSGKSLSMVFYAGKLVHSLDNPTIVVITDRNDLDQQLFDTFAGNLAGFIFNVNQFRFKTVLGAMGFIGDYDNITTVG